MSTRETTHRKPPFLRLEIGPEMGGQPLAENLITCCLPFEEEGPIAHMARRFSFARHRRYFSRGMIQSYGYDAMVLDTSTGHYRHAVLTPTCVGRGTNGKEFLFTVEMFGRRFSAKKKRRRWMIKGCPSSATIMSIGEPNTDPKP